MLIRFRVQNHLSLRDTQELSFVASKSAEANEVHTSDALPDYALSPALVIYGANASGKSNVIEALKFMQRAIIMSHTANDSRGGVPRQPFALNKTSARSPSVFEIDFIAGEQRYRYGFEADDDAFISEWLYAYPNGKQTRFFVRSGQDFEFGRNFKGRNKAYAEFARPNSLFLSVAAQQNHPMLREVISFFNFNFVSRNVDAHSIQESVLSDDGELDPRIITFLSQIETGIVAVRVSPHVVDEENKKFQDSLFEFLKQNLPGPGGDLLRPGPEPKNFELGHKGQDDNVYYLALARESSGTRRMLNLLGAAFRAIDHGSIVIMDEMDASLHTQASLAIVGLFNDLRINKHGAQLIAAVHDTNLLKPDVLPKDEIWCMRKDVHGASTLYPLSDVITRRDENLEKGYLQGRYGALPFSGDIDSLLDVFR